MPLYKAVYNDGTFSDPCNWSHICAIIKYSNQKRMVRKVVAVIRWQ